MQNNDVNECKPVPVPSLDADGPLGEEQCIQNLRQNLRQWMVHFHAMVSRNVLMTYSLAHFMSPFHANASMEYLPWRSQPSTGTLRFSHDRRISFHTVDLKRPHCRAIEQSTMTISHPSLSETAGGELFSNLSSPALTFEHIAASDIVEDSRSSHVTYGNNKMAFVFSATSYQWRDEYFDNQPGILAVMDHNENLLMAHHKGAICLAIIWIGMTVPFVLSLIIWNGLVYCLFMLGIAFFGFLMCGRTAYYNRGNFPSHTALTSEGIKFVDGSKFNHGAVYMFPFQDIVSMARVKDSPALCQLVLANPVSSYLQEPPLGRTQQSNTNKIQIEFLENVTMLIMIAMALKTASSSAPTLAVPLGGNMSQVAATVVSTRNGPVIGNIQMQLNQWVESLRSHYLSADTVA